MPEPALTLTSLLEFTAFLEKLDGALGVVGADTKAALVELEFDHPTTPDVPDPAARSEVDAPSLAQSRYDAR